jgi:hypothetical protein
VKCGEFIKYLRNYWLHKKESTPWSSLVIAWEVVSWSLMHKGCERKYTWFKLKLEGSEPGLK